jgi:hypothetical protein
MHNKNTIKNILVSSILAIGLSWLLYAFTIDPNINNAFQLIQRIWVTDNGTTTGGTIIDLNTGSNNIYIGTSYLPITAPYNSNYLLTLNSNGYISFTTGNDWITGVVVSGVNIVGNSLMVTLTNGVIYSGGTLPSGGGWVAQIITLSDTILSLDQNGGTVDLTWFLQTISLNNDILSISSGNTISLSPYKQTLSIVGSGLSISSGNTVYLQESPWTTGSIADTLTVRGRGNTVSGTHSIAWGSGNTILSIWSTIAWGYNNTISGSNYSFIGGGETNNIQDSRHSIIAWGNANTIQNSMRSFILGEGINIEAGLLNTSIGYLSTISGQQNTTIGWEITVNDSSNNYMIGELLTITQGLRNRIFGYDMNIEYGVENILIGYWIDVNWVLWQESTINRAIGIDVTFDPNTSNNTAIGTDITFNQNTSNNTAIGHRLSFLSPTQNSILLWQDATVNRNNIFFRNDGSITQVADKDNSFIIGATGGVGINTISPATDLHVQWWSILGSVTSVAVMPAGNNIWNTTIQSTTLQSYQYIAIDATQSGAIVQVQLEPLSSPKDNGKEITIFKYNEDVHPFTMEFYPGPHISLPDETTPPGPWLPFRLLEADNDETSWFFSQIVRSKSVTFLRYNNQRHLIHAI